MIDDARDEDNEDVNSRLYMYSAQMKILVFFHLYVFAFVGLQAHLNFIDMFNWTCGLSILLHIYLNGTTHVRHTFKSSALNVYQSNGKLDQTQ